MLSENADFSHTAQVLIDIGNATLLKALLSSLGEPQPAHRTIVSLLSCVSEDHTTSPHRGCGVNSTISCPLIIYYSNSRVVKWWKLCQTTLWAIFSTLYGTIICPREGRCYYLCYPKNYGASQSWWKFPAR